MNQIYKSFAAATIALTAAVALSACNDNRDCSFDGDAHTLTCPEKTYATVDMGGKVWMAENLVVYVPDSSVCYGNDHANCDAMGRLYTWNAANNGLWHGLYGRTQERQRFQDGAWWIQVL